MGLWVLGLTEFYRRPSLGPTRLFSKLNLIQNIPVGFSFISN